MVVTVSARISIAGLHHWPEAPPARSYLAHDHRHLFEVTATVEAEHDDRAVEFHDLAAAIHDALGTIGHPWPHDRHLRQFGPRSCEQIGREVAWYLTDAGMTVTLIAVSEDGEHTATLEAPCT